MMEKEKIEKVFVFFLSIRMNLLSFLLQRLQNSQQDLQVKFSKLCPYSSDYQYKVPYDSVMAIATPDSGLQEVYRAKVEMLNQMMQQNSQTEPETITPEVMPNE